MLQVEILQVVVDSQDVWAAAFLLEHLATSAVEFQWIAFTCRYMCLFLSGCVLRWKGEADLSFANVFGVYSVCIRRLVGFASSPLWLWGGETDLSFANVFEVYSIRIRSSSASPPHWVVKERNTCIPLCIEMFVEYIVFYQNVF